MGAEEPGFIRALSQVTVYEISEGGIAKVLRERPDLADEIGATLASRLEAEAVFAGETVSAAHRPLTIAHRIRQLFHLQTPERH